MRIESDGHSRGNPRLYQLITRSQAGMTLTPGGTRLLGTASQIVVLGAEAHAAVRAAQGAPEQLRIVATSTSASAPTTSRPR